MDSRIELRHLRYFLTVAEELHFSRAARKLHIAQPALSQQIRQLEKYMGVTLFRRTSRVVELSDAGRSFQLRARELLQGLTDDVDEARRIARGESGRLDLAFISSASSTVGRILRLLTDRYPNVLLRLHEGFTSTVIDRLEHGAADIGIVRDADESPGMVLATIHEEPFVAVLPLTHELAATRQVSAAQLSSSPLVLFPQSAGIRAYARNMRPFHEVDVDPVISFHGSEWNTILHLVAAGLGVTIAPESATHPLPTGTVALPLTGTEARSSIQIVHRAHHTNPLIDVVRSLATIR
ncbi:LysR substrate-binding domain-containing protein [uncultured Leifsonia sp.]|uniref:LysR family transcriptional regulator n=1 Tax=uncultured Leifsonia sp. TaxID=340359 RepID=UPI0028D3FC5D|nr:LysR substrate-binding domain-containing protein [uncultured Leifsonia sp.]